MFSYSCVIFIHLGNLEESQSLPNRKKMKHTIGKKTLHRSY